jgi:transcriptional regulator with XRE-family HTH domain
LPLSTTPTVVKRYIALELRRLRKAAGLKQEEVAEVIDTSQTRIAHLESMRNLPKLHDLEKLLERYGAPELTPGIQELIIQLREAAGPTFEIDTTAQLPPGFDLYLGLEQGASRIVCYSAMTAHGMLQCRPYAEALLRGHDASLPDSELERRVDLRMRRRAALDRPDPVLEFVAVIDESVLHRQIGGPEVLAAQLDYLVESSRQPNVSLRVLPFTAGVHKALDGAFVVLKFPIERDPGVVYLQDRIGNQFRDHVKDIVEYTAVADHLQGLALSEADSLALIKKVRKEVGT